MHIPTHIHMHIYPMCNDLGSTLMPMQICSYDWLLVSSIKSILHEDNLNDFDMGSK